MKGMPALYIVGLAIMAALLVSLFWGGSARSQTTPNTSQQGSSAEVTVPARPSTPLFQGKQGKQRPETSFNPSTRTVTLKILVQDPNGYFLPNLRRENFAVFEDGVRQKNVTVEVEHAPVVLAVLMEFGGRYTELNKILSFEVPRIGRALLDDLGRDDRVMLLKYADQVQTLADFNQGHEILDSVFDQLSTPGFSEANFYDALVETIPRMEAVKGRKAILAITSGIDTFSKTSYEQALDAARNSSAPIYVLGLTRFMSQEASVSGPSAPFAHIDWKGIEQRLQALADASGGRAYIPDSDLAIAAIYDDIMENLRLRYVITYVSSNPALSGAPRKIRVELVDPKTGSPLQIRDAQGKPITAKVFVQDVYNPGAAAEL
jgi:VWFA-related protein